MTDEQKEEIIKGISGPDTAENIGVLVRMFGSKEKVSAFLVSLIPPGQQDLNEIITSALKIAFERIARQKEGEEILKLGG